MEKIAYRLIVGMLTVVSWLPLKVHYIFSDFLYFLFYKIIRYRLSTVVTNIARAYPQADYKEIDKITKGFYHSLCDTIVEAVWAFTRSRERVAELLDFRGCDVLNEAYGQGKNVLVVMGHQSNWELYTSLPDLQSFYGLKMDNEHFFYIYKKMSSKLSDRVLKRIRSKHKSCVLIEKNNVVRILLQNKSVGGVYYFLADQCPDNGSGTDLEFLNQRTRVYDGPEGLARRLSLPVVFFDVERVRRGLYKSEYIKICDDASKTEPGYVTEEYVRLMERGINKNRSNWLWSHRRWKKID